MSAECADTLIYVIGCRVAKLRRGECLCVANVKLVIERFPYNTSVYYALFDQLITYTHARELGKVLSKRQDGGQKECGIRREIGRNGSVSRICFYSGTDSSSFTQERTQEKYEQSEET